MSRIIQLGTSHPKKYLPTGMGDALALDTSQPEIETYTQIAISPDSSLRQAVDECRTVWAIHAHEYVPMWIGHNKIAASLATILADEFGGNIEMRTIR